MCKGCHVVAVKGKVKSLSALVAACKRLGGELRVGQENYRWYGQWVNDYHKADAYRQGISTEDHGKCDHAIHFAGIDYEVG